MNSGGSSSTSSRSPYGPAVNQVDYGLNQATVNLQNEGNVPIPTQYTAPTNGMQTDATQGIYDYGMGLPSTYGIWGNVGQNLASTQGAYTSNAEGIAQNGIGAQSPSTQMLQHYAQTGQMNGTSSINPALGSAVTQAGTQGLSALGQGQSALNGVAQAGLNTNGAMGAAMQGAAQYSDNPTLSAAIQAANYQTNLGLTENTLPQIRAAAMQDGNANSSREGALEGIATQSASANMANTAANMESNAYNTGAQLGETGYLQSLNEALSAGNGLTANGTSAGNLTNTQQGLQQSQNQFGTSAQLSAANSAASQDLNYQTANTGAQLAANGQLGTGLTTGLNATNEAATGSLAGLTAAQGAGTYNQQQAQNTINNNLDYYQQQISEPSQLLNQYWNVVGSAAGLGGSTSSTTTPNNGGVGGALAGALGGGMAGSSFGNGLYNAYTSIFGNPSTQLANSAVNSGNTSGSYNTSPTPAATGSLGTANLDFSNFSPIGSLNFGG